MLIRRSSVLFCSLLAVAISSTCVAAQAASGPVPAGIETFQLPSHGALLNAFVYTAAGAGPHPAVVLLHGFPGNEKNLDLAQDIRRAGWDVLYFDYRGSWGSPGDFSFEHTMEDVPAALAYLRDPANAAKLRLDPKRIAVVGHSMGGWMALETGAVDHDLLGVGIISGADMTGRIPENFPPQAMPIVEKKVAESLAAEGMAPLAGCTPESLAKEAIEHRVAWAFRTSAAKLNHVPLLVVSSDDGLADADNAMADAAAKAGNTKVVKVHYATDHSYSDKRLELSQTVLDWLGTLPGHPLK
ncbi:Alpha/beta hydrolase family protein [Bryocella elongata]|uniref:Alpha/beta hydrolase family protein n=1 Tax=Bryocella elongata TaxID=863522 RepID=A0A1H6BR94_9BACT|nr:alpha/beta hydrolase [Bryocella elongata]SEG63170.1 Alpha/beta hydrolase family protein [Bryocella elongata]